MLFSENTYAWEAWPQVKKHLIKEIKYTAIAQLIKIEDNWVMSDLLFHTQEAAIEHHNMLAELESSQGMKPSSR